MWLLKLSWKNMWRNKHRTTITISAIFFAVVLSVVTSSLQDGVFDNLIKNVVSFYSGYLQVHKQGYWDERILDNSFEASVSLEQQILQPKNVTGLAPRLESFALASSEELTKGCVVIGISPQRENTITALQNKVIEGEYLIENDVGVLLAQGLAARLRLQLHDTLILIGQGYHGATAAGKYFIKGIVKFGSPDLNEQSLFLSLAAAQDLYSANGRVTSYVLALKNPADLNSTAESVRTKLGGTYETMTWEEMMPEIIQHIQTDKGSMYIIQGILYLLVCFGIFGTLLMMMVERKYEMGMLVAIGMKKIKLMQLLLVESVLTVFSGCIVGITVSIPIVYYLNKYPIRFTGEMAKVYEEFGFEAIFPSSTDSGIFITQGLIVLGLGLLLSLYSIIKIAALNPVTAMKK
ncbi:MAG: ABC transporter permease [Cytophagales bacterium]|jgi:putative ABC transport system permease protein|nr:ABC transporter permease [Cytophagales bacterium]MCA6389137.1 ABC transporter permease [Cytophagales bacterium]MCA6391987.1 ABC transporter permease [Cytophagales bacterium]MCA6395954.1 ABC transporter permease [Cytophagales bacterium]MCA6398292.1 ABC transporter permease [Cytophagales bacterium]